MCLFNEFSGKPYLAVSLLGILSGFLLETLLLPRGHRLLVVVFKAPLLILWFLLLLFIAICFFLLRVLSF